MPPRCGGNFLFFLGGGRGVREWRSGESNPLKAMWPGFDSQTRRHMLVEFGGFLHCTESLFSGYSGFPLSSKTNICFDLR